MATKDLSAYDINSVPSAENMRFGVVVAEWNIQITGALANGADAVVDYSQSEWRKQLTELTKTTGLDMVYDPVGGDATETALRSLAPDGRLLVVGCYVSIAGS